MTRSFAVIGALLAITLGACTSSPTWPRTCRWSPTRAPADHWN
jgi:hypothetical protein